MPGDKSVSLIVIEATGQMPVEYKAVVIDQLISLPSRRRNLGDRGRVVADMLTTALNEMAASGWQFVTTYRGADDTIFIFQKPMEKDENG